MNALDTIYAQIPAVKGCRTGCNDCCGPVPAFPAEAARIVSPMLMQDSPLGKLLPSKPDCLTCAYSTPLGCSIYANRPIICRLFGAVDHPRLTCPHGAKADRLLTDAQSRTLIAKAQAA